VTALEKVPSSLVYGRAGAGCLVRDDPALGR